MEHHLTCRIWTLSFSSKGAHSVRSVTCGGSGVGDGLEVTGSAAAFLQRDGEVTCRSLPPQKEDARRAGVESGRSTVVNACLTLISRHLDCDAEVQLDKSCNGAKAHQLDESCNGAKANQLDKSCNGAKAHQLDKSCNGAKAHQLDKSCNRAKAHQLDKSCNGAKAHQLDESCNGAKCKGAKTHAVEQGNERSEVVSGAW